MEKWLVAGQHASKSCKYFKTRKIDLLVFENLENFEQFESKLESNWHWPKMRKNDRFLIKNEFQRPRLGGVFLITKSVSLLWSRTDFDLWKSFQSRLLRPNGRLRRKQFTRRFELSDSRFCFDMIEQLHRLIKRICHKINIMQQFKNYDDFVTCNVQEKSNFSQAKLRHHRRKIFWARFFKPLFPPCRMG